MQEEQQLKLDIVDAEKKRLEAASNNWEASFNEINLKYKLKTHQFNSLAANRRNIQLDEKSKSSIGTQTIKEEPKSIGSIGVVNVPRSCSSQHATPNLSKSSKTIQPNAETEANNTLNAGAKRKRSEIRDSENQERRKSQRMDNFVCETCIYDWGNKYKNPSSKLLPDPANHIATFTSIRDLKLHMVEKHKDGLFKSHASICNQKNCVQFKNHESYKCHPHGDLTCNTCGVTFKFKNDLARHIKLVHCNISKMSIDKLLKLHDLC